MGSRKTRKTVNRTVRGDAKATREKLLNVCARIFNREGYGGTDTNRIARAAGFAPGTFYKHFDDKLDAFLAVYARMLDGEWVQIGGALGQGGTPRELSERVVDVVLAHHKTWRMFRAGLRVLVLTSPEVRKVFRATREKQLDTMAALRSKIGAPHRARDEDALLLFVLERLADALADDEAEALGVQTIRLRNYMVEQVLTHLTP